MYYVLDYDYGLQRPQLLLWLAALANRSTPENYAPPATRSAYGPAFKIINIIKI